MDTLRVARQTWPPLIAFIFTLILTLQYPLSSSFPIGGDAARSIIRAQAVMHSTLASPLTGLHTLATNSNYPLATLIIATSRIIPISWPSRWIWLTVFGYLATGATIGYVTTKAAGWRAGALSLAAWGITGMSFTKNFIDATLAQLLSFPVLILGIYVWSQKRWVIGSLLLIATYLIHPLSAAMLVITIIWVYSAQLGSALRWQFWKRYWWYIGSTAAALIVIWYALWHKIAAIITYYPASDEGVSLHDIFTSPVGPLAILALLGGIIIASQKRAIANWLLAFSLVSLGIFWHFHFLGHSIFLGRFQPYLAITIAVLAGISLDYIWTRVFHRHTIAGFGTMSLLFLGLGLQTWQQNAVVFNFFDSPSRYENVHITEREAFAWAGENLPANSTVITTQNNRHPEWIPILTDLSWIGLGENDLLFKSDPSIITNIAHQHHYNYILFLKKQEKPGEVMPTVTSFPTVFENEGVQIIDITKHE